MYWVLPGDRQQEKLLTGISYLDLYNNAGLLETFKMAHSLDGLRHQVI